MSDLLHLAIYLGLVVGLSLPLGWHLARVYENRPTVLTPVVGGLEHLLLRLGGCSLDAQQKPLAYLGTLLAFNALGAVFLYGLLLFQGMLPWNPAHLPGLRPDLAFNVAVSFVTNTNWQSYGGESTLSPLSQSLGLVTQNFLSAATGMAVAAAIIRSLAGRDSMGHFHVDLVRSVVHVLLPIALLGSLFLVSQGVPQNWGTPVAAQTVESRAAITIPEGPVASQISIKQLGTNGGGYFNANSAHPYENPTPLSNLIEAVFILLIPAAFPWAFGRMAGDPRQGRAVFIAMLVLFLGGATVMYWAEQAPNPTITDLSISPMANMEGKEVRLSVRDAAFWATATTAASNGSVNSMHDSFTPLGGMVAMINMMLGEVIFGGVGAGFYTMFVFVVLTVFIAGLMVGRTPEYLGKKIESREIKLAMLAELTIPAGTLLLAALTAVLPSALRSVQDAGPHGLSEILYAYTSATANNGSAFAGFNANTIFHNTCLGLAMLIGRYGIIVPVLLLAGGLLDKKRLPVTSGTFPTHGPIFVVLLIAVVVIVGGLTFFPALALGPIAEHLIMTGHGD